MLANVAAAALLVQTLTGEDAAEEAKAAPSEQASPVVLEARAESPGTLVPEPVEPARELGDAELAARLETHIASAVRDASKRSQGKANAGNTVIAVHVFDPTRREALVSRQHQVPLRPASCMKLVTSAAALVKLGDDWNFETTLHSAGSIAGDVLQGDLVVCAGGDPFYEVDAKGRVSHLFAPAVQALRDAGIRRVSGDLVLDEGTFLDPGPGPGWPSSDQHWQEHCALSAGFTANAGCLTAVVESRKNGQSAWSEVRPKRNGLERIGRVATVSAKSRLNINVGANAASATLKGEIPSSVPAWDSRFAHPDPVQLFAESFSAALRAGGIEVAGSVRRERGVPPGRTLAILRTPLTDVLAPINRDSNNSVADQLFFALGDAVAESGTREGGARAVALALGTLGVSGEGLHQVDGSGLSRDDRVTAQQLSSLLAGVLELEPGTRDAFIDSLAVAGRTGSLALRMKSAPTLGRVHAKTGWIEGTGSLSGYVETLGGRWLCFSILVDYPKVSGLNKYCWKPMQDRICEELARWSPSGGKVR